MAMIIRGIDGTSVYLIKVWLVRKEKGDDDNDDNIVFFIFKSLKSP